MKLNSNLLNGTNINMGQFETNSMNGGSAFDSESHISFNSIKIKNQSLFPKPVSDAYSQQQVLPELSYFTTSMPLMTLNPNSQSFNEKSKKLPKLKTNHSYYFKTNTQNFKPTSNASNKSGIN